MTGFLLSRPFLRAHGQEFLAAAGSLGLEPEVIEFPDDPAARLEPPDRERIQVAYFSSDVYGRELSRGFFAATQGAPNLRWLHVFNAGVDAPVFMRLVEGGVRLTTSSGSTAQPIAQTAIAGMLMLARGFPAWGEAQRSRLWRRHAEAETPADLERQQMVVVGLGAIGSEIARLATAIGLRVVGIRRSPWREGDVIADVRPPSALPGLLPTTDWLALACPLTAETRHLVDARLLADLKRGARVLNVGRGEVVDEPALVEALRSGRVGGAYLDVFEEEPLPAGSPLWAMANVIVTPHNSAASTGNDARVFGYFMRNLRAWARGEPLVNEVR